MSGVLWPRSPAAGRAPRGQAHLRQLAQQRRRHPAHGGAEVGDEAQARRADLLVELADLEHLRRVRPQRRVDLPAQGEVEVLGHGISRRISSGLALWIRTSGKPSARALRNRVAVNSYSSSGVMSRSRRRPMSRLQPNELGTKPVPVEGSAPVADELVGDLRVGAQRLRGDDLDAGADAGGVHRVEQAVAGRSGRPPTRW